LFDGVVIFLSIRIENDPEDRVIGCYPLAVRDGRRRAEADVGSCPRRETDVLLDNWAPTFDGDLFEPHLSSPTADDLGLPLGSPHVLHPFALPEHRHEILLALMPGYDDSDRVGTNRPPPLHLQSHLSPRW